MLLHRLEREKNEILDNTENKRNILEHEEHDFPLSMYAPNFSIQLYHREAGLTRFGSVLLACSFAATYRSKSKKWEYFIRSQ